MSTDHIRALESTYGAALAEPVGRFLSSAEAATPTSLSFTGFISGTLTAHFTDEALRSWDYDLAARTGIDDLEEVPWQADYAGYVPLAVLDSSTGPSGSLLVVDTRTPPNAVCLFDKDGWTLYPCASSFEAFLASLPEVALGKGFLPSAPSVTPLTGGDLSDRLRRADPEAAKPLLDELFALPSSPQKAAAMRAYFELYPERRTGAWTKPTLATALTWLRTEGDASIAPLLVRCLVSNLPEVSLLLARLDATLGRENLDLTKVALYGAAVLTGLVTLDGIGSAAFTKAEELFGAYERLSVVKPKDAENIAFGAIALAASHDPAAVARVLPFARGEKVVGSVAKEHAAKVMQFLRDEGLA